MQIDLFWIKYFIGKYYGAMGSDTQDLIICGFEDLAENLQELIQVYIEGYQGIEKYAYSKRQEVKQYIKWLYKRGSGGFAIARKGLIVGFI